MGDEGEGGGGGGRTDKGRKVKEMNVQEKYYNKLLSIAYVVIHHILITSHIQSCQQVLSRHGQAYTHCSQSIDMLLVRP